MCAFILFVLSLVYVAALRRADPPSVDSYRLCIRITKLKKGPEPNKGRRAIDK
jgi:hypothetical protein